ncbi:MAG: cation diffusion facilitator family transporter [Dehalococcoidia bacterium]
MDDIDSTASEPRSQALDSTQRGMWAVKVSFVGLLATATFQAVVVAFSGSAALLADTIHNFADATSAIPLWIAFALSRRRETRQYTYGYHRAEDLAGVLILLFIAASAVFAGFESVRKLLSGETPRYLGWALGAGAVGFLGNEAVAQFRIRVGKRIGSAALVADGHHARTDGLTSLAVVLGLIGVLLGFPIADPIVGLVITAVIVVVLVREAGPLVLSRILDRVDPQLVEEIERVARNIPGVLHTHHVRARWIGHLLVAELCISVDGQLTVAQGHQIAEQVQHQMLHGVPMLYRCSVHVDPLETGESLHTATAHHYPEHQRGHTSETP